MAQLNLNFTRIRDARGEARRAILASILLHALTLLNVAKPCYHEAAASGTREALGHNFFEKCHNVR